jgi:hypothetical protein
MIAIAERAKAQVKKVEEVKHQVEEAALHVPTSAFLGFGLACCTAASILHFAGKKKAASAVGMWVPAAFALALYMKLKQHDRRFMEHATHS